jgi:hypothetical protein
LPNGLQIEDALIGIGKEANPGKKARKFLENSYIIR